MRLDRVVVRCWCCSPGEVLLLFEEVLILGDVCAILRMNPNLVPPKGTCIPQAWNHFWVLFFSSQRYNTDASVICCPTSLLALKVRTLLILLPALSWEMVIPTIIGDFPIKCSPNTLIVSDCEYCVITMGLAMISGIASSNSFVR